MKRYGVMVIYNQKLESSVTMKALEEAALSGYALPLVIVDNSSDESVARENNIWINGKNKGDYQYLPQPENPGLAISYNRAVEAIVTKGCFGKVEDQDYILFFDDDTKVNLSYMEEVFGDLKDSIYLPVMKDELGIMSPVYMPGMVAKRIASVEALEKIPEKELSGINSGMVVRIDSFHNHRYNEGMFLDYIDHKWMLDLRKDGIYPKVLKAEIWQNFSAIQDGKEEAYRRFARQKKDLRIFYEGHPCSYWWVVLKKQLKLLLKYR